MSGLFGFRSRNTQPNKLGSIHNFMVEKRLCAVAFEVQRVIESEQDGTQFTLRRFKRREMGAEHRLRLRNQAILVLA